MAAIVPNSPEDVLLIALNEQNASGQSGWARLVTSGGVTQVTLFISEGVMTSRRVDVYSGRCGDSIGAAVHRLTNLTDGMSISLLEGVSLDTILNGNFAVNVNNSGLTVYTACGNIPATTNSITIALDELNDSGQSGWATLTSRGGDTEVVLSLSSGVMASNLVHVHSGQCGDSLGGVAQGLTDIADGISVTLLEGVSLDSILTGGFAVNAHSSADASIYTACGNLPAREPVSGGSPVILQSAIVNAILADLTISVGTTVTWTEEDITGHTTTSGSRGLFDGIGWDSGTLKQGDSFSYTFTEVGTFPYTCEIHPTMNATVTVT